MGPVHQDRQEVHIQGIHLPQRQGNQGEGAGTRRIHFGFGFGFGSEVVRSLLEGEGMLACRHVGLDILVYLVEGVVQSWRLAFGQEWGREQRVVPLLQLVVALRRGLLRIDLNRLMTISADANGRVESS